jgi:hypothetical protein
MTNRMREEIVNWLGPTLGVLIYIMVAWVLPVMLIFTIGGFIGGLFGAR